MKLASTLLLVLNLGASAASDKQLHLRGGGEENARRLTPMTDTSTVSPAPTVSQAPSVSLAPTTSEPTAAPSQKPTEAPTSEPTPAPSQKPTVPPTSKPTTAPTNKPTLKPTPAPSQKPTVPPTSKPTTAPTNKPTLKPCSADVLVPIGYYDDYDWNELPVCVQEAGELFDYRASGAMAVQYSDSSCMLTNCIAYFIIICYAFARQYYSNFHLAAMFGYDQNIWDSGQKSCPWWCDEWWDDLTSRQRWAARVFGYNRSRWNSS
jgi:hypothetical protein